MEGHNINIITSEKGHEWMTMFSKSICMEDLSMCTTMMPCVMGVMIPTNIKTSSKINMDWMYTIMQYSSFLENNGCDMGGGGCDVPYDQSHAKPIQSIHK